MLLNWEVEFQTRHNIKLTSDLIHFIECLIIETKVSKTHAKGFVRQQTILLESIARHRSRKYKTFNCLEPFFGISDTSIVRFGQLQSNRYQAQQICCCRRRRRRRRFATDDATVTTTSASSSCRHRHRHCCLFGKFGFFAVSCTLHFGFKSPMALLDVMDLIFVWKEKG